MNFLQILKSAASRLAKRSPTIGFNFNRPGIDSSAPNKFDRAYEQSVWVNRAIKLIALPISEAPIRFSTQRGSRQLLNNGALTEFWESPAIGSDKQPIDFSYTIESTVGWLKLTGNAFWLLEDSALASVPFPDGGRAFPRFVIARPDSMRPVRDKSGGLLGWKYSNGNGGEVPLAIDQVIHFRLWNPYDSCLGLGELSAARTAAEADFLAGIYETNLWKNAGDRGPIIGLPEGVTLTDAQREQFVAQLREKRELAARGIFKAAFIDAAVTVADPTVQQIDAAVIASRAADATAIAIAFGIPPSMFTVAASYSVGSASDRYRLIEDTCAPTARKIAEGIERVSRMLLRDRNVFAWFDWSRHSVFAQVRAERIAASATAWDRGVPWEKLNEWLNLEMPQFEGWEKSFLPFSAQPADALSAESEDASAMQEEEPQPGEMLDTTQGEDEPAAEEEPEETAAEQLAKAFRKKTQTRDRDPAELKTWRAHMDKRRGAMRRYQSAIDRQLMAARSETLRNLQASGIGKGMQQRASLVEIVFDAAKFSANMKSALRKAGVTTLKEAGGQLFAEIGLKPSQYEMANDKVNGFLKKRENFVSDMTDAMHKRVKTTLAEGIDNGETTDQLASRVRDTFNDISKGQARTIATTEVGSAYSEARQDAMEQAGVERKQWLTSGDDKVRPSHIAANGQTVGIAENFDVGGESLTMPGDPNGPAAEIINCRCISIAVLDQ